MKKAKRLWALILAAVLLSVLSACNKGSPQKASSAPGSSSTAESQPAPASSSEPSSAAESGSAEVTGTLEPDALVIRLSGDSAAIGSEAVEEFDYTWHCDPSTVHDEVKNAPAEYYTGTKPETDAAVYIDHELYYYPELPESGFKQINYDGEREWAYYYTDGENDEYIFSTLPSLGNSLPTQMMHSEEEAAENKVLHITKPGVYALEGTWQGQIRIDLGDKDETFSDENAKVTLILNGAEIDCSVAPGIVFYSAYECDSKWEEQESWSSEVDTSSAGVSLIVGDGTENTVTGTNIFRMLKTQYKDENSSDTVKVQKKMRKLDGALYSYVSMNIEGGEKGDGTLTVDSGFEGIDSELHLSFNGGSITINSQDDGINVNEDNVSVVSFNGGSVLINAAQGAEGDGVDSNGFIVLDGGTVSVNGVTAPDSALDSENGVYYNGGTIIIDGEEQSYSAGDVFRETGGGPGGMGIPGGMGGPEGAEGGMGGPGFGPQAENFDIAEFKEKVAALDDSATLQDVFDLLGMKNRGNELPAPEASEAP